VDNEPNADRAGLAHRGYPDRGSALATREVEEFVYRPLVVGVFAVLASEHAAIAGDQEIGW
jgi:hypothetical protein